MADVLKLDFSGAPPAQGSIVSHIPPGQYPLRVMGAEQKKSQAGKPYVQVDFAVADGEHRGTRLRDQFVFQKEPSDSNFGLRRFHAFLLALKFQVNASGQTTLNLAALTNKLTLADVVDDEQPASQDGKYPARTISRPNAYYTIDQYAAMRAAPIAEAAQSPAAAVAAATAVASAAVAASTAVATKAAAQTATAVAEPEELAEEAVEEEGGGVVDTVDAGSIDELFA